MREQFPVCVAFADRVREAFGGDVKMVYAKENGQEIGCPDDRPGDKPVRFAQMVIESIESDSVTRNKSGKLVAKRGK